MDQVNDIPGVTHLKIETYHAPNCWLTTMFVHHQLTEEEKEKFARALELVLPSILKMMISL